MNNDITLHLTGDHVEDAILVFRMLTSKIPATTYDNVMEIADIYASPEDGLTPEERAISRFRYIKRPK